MNASFAGFAEKLLSPEGKKKVVKVAALAAVGLAAMGFPFHSAAAASSDNTDENASRIKMEDRAWAPSEEDGIRRMFGLQGDIKETLYGIPAQEGKPPRYIDEISDQNGTSLVYKGFAQEELTINKDGQTTVLSRDAEQGLLENGQKIVTGVSANPQAELMRNRMQDIKLKAVKGYVLRRVSAAFTNGAKVEGRKADAPEVATSTTPSKKTYAFVPN